MESLRWSALEYEEKEHSRDWFWALGVIVVAGSVASVIYGDYFFAGLLILGGVLLGFFAIKKPDTIEYELSERGLRAGTRLYPYDNIRSFFVRTDPGPALLIHSDRIFLPVISIPIDPEMAEDIYGAMIAHEIPEEKLTEHSSEKIMDSLGF
ncbi:MAG TPA: hypothetical protein VG694_01325 [Candidatus Paceibacterota bacterium]|jgi:hypothetical protein|nr:hypothetical protein [Candidatus Paceibacterota bacterium]